MREAWRAERQGVLSCVSSHETLMLFLALLWKEGWCVGVCDVLFVTCLTWSEAARKLASRWALVLSHALLALVGKASRTVWLEMHGVSSILSRLVYADRPALYAVWGCRLCCLGTDSSTVHWDALL
jgi:hypothetical protein